MDFLASCLIVDKLKYCRKIISSKFVPCEVPESLQRDAGISLLKYTTSSFLIKLQMQTGSSGVRVVCFRLDFVPRQLAIQTSKPPSAKMKPSDCFGVLNTQQKPSCPINSIFILVTKCIQIVYIMFNNVLTTISPWNKSTGVLSSVELSALERPWGILFKLRI